MSIWCRHLKINHIIENVYCVVLEFSCGRYIAVICHHILILYSPLWLRLLFIRYVLFFCMTHIIAHPWQILHLKMQIIRPEIPHCCPSSLAEIMNHVKSPNKRPAMVEIVTVLKAIDTSKDLLINNVLFILLLPVGTSNLYLAGSRNINLVHNARTHS